ncbi:MAG: metallophosphoesterase [Caldilineales bacterium]|nr:metallophosphoesterase [Caldilineales bacterium]
MVSPNAVAVFLSRGLSLLLTWLFLSGSPTGAGFPRESTPPPDATVTFAVIGDYGAASPAEAKVAALVASWRPAFILTTGDNYYRGAGDPAHPYDGSTGRYFCAFLHGVQPGPWCRSDAMSRDGNRFFPALGNHDYSDAGLNRYLAYFTLPGNGLSSTSGNERYYDFVWGPVHVFVLNSNAVEPDGIRSDSRQARWLRTGLAASTTPWQVVILHHPPYSSGPHGSTPDLQWPFAAWGADVVIAGHDHTYERIVRDGIVYIVNGLGGGARYGLRRPVTGSVFRYNADWGALRVTATATTLDLAFYRVGDDRRPVDRYRIRAVAWVPSPAFAEGGLAQDAILRYVFRPSYSNGNWTTAPVAAERYAARATSIAL